MHIKSEIMKPLLQLTFILLIGTLVSCNHNKTNDYTGYTALEIEAETCLDEWFESKDVDGDELKTIFENYFNSGDISNRKDSIETQYRDILGYLERPTKQFPLFKDKQKVIASIKKLGLSEENIIEKLQLNCVTNIYLDHKAEIDTLSSFYVLGSMLETIKKVPDISPGLTASAINASIDKANLNKTLYQKTIVLMYCFDMTLFLSDGKE